MLPYDDRIADGYGSGVAVPVATATLTVGGKVLNRPVGPVDRDVVFDVALVAGATELEATFTTADGDQVGAYCVYVEPAGSEGGAGTRTTLRPVPLRRR